MGYDHLLAKNRRLDGPHAGPPGFEPWVGPLRLWAKQWAGEMELSGHPEYVVARVLPRLATDAMVGRLCDSTHRGARLRYIATLSGIKPHQWMRAERFVCEVQRAIREHFRGDSHR